VELRYYEQTNKISTDCKYFLYCCWTHDLCSFILVKDSISASDFTFNLIFLIHVCAFGLLKLMPWARYAAIIILVVNVISFLRNSIHDTIIVYDHSFGSIVKIITVFIAVTMIAIIFAVQAGIIWWLSKRSTKTLFEH
jgi:hypothetical protein